MGFRARTVSRAGAVARRSGAHARTTRISAALSWKGPLDEARALAHQRSAGALRSCGVEVRVPPRRSRRSSKQARGAGSAALRMRHAAGASSVAHAGWRRRAGAARDPLRSRARVRTRRWSRPRTRRPTQVLTDDDPMPPERFAVLVGANHAEPGWVTSRYLGKKARVTVVRVLGGRPKDATVGEEADPRGAHRRDRSRCSCAGKTARPTCCFSRTRTVGRLDRSREGSRRDAAAVEVRTCRDRSVIVTSDEPARFALGESSVDVGQKPEWISARAGAHQAYIVVALRRAR